MYVPIYWKLDGTTLHLSNTKHTGYLNYSEYDTKTRNNTIKVVIDETLVLTDSFTGNMSPFKNCYSLEAIEGVNRIDVSNCTTLESLFLHCGVKQLDLSSWDVSNITSMKSMFSGCGSLTELDMTGWDTSSLENVSSMFKGIKLTHLDLSHWDTSKIHTYQYIFEDSKLVEINLSHWSMGNVQHELITGMFYACTSLEHIYVTKNTDWSLYKSVYGDADVFYGCINLPHYDGATFNKTKANDSATGYFTSLEPSGSWYHKVNGVWKQGQRYTKKNGIWVKD